MQKKNAVERRLEWLHEQWVEFARQPEARLLRWVVEAEEVRMVDISTLPYVAEALVRLRQARQGEAAARHMEAEANALLGQGWRSSLQAAGGQAA